MTKVVVRNFSISLDGYGALIDELYLAISPVLLGKGDNLLEGLDTRALGYECHKHDAGGRAAAHVFLRKRGLSAL